MKKISILLSFLVVLFISCEGEPGPPGFDGFDGIDGRDGIDGQDGADGLIGNIFEADITFNSGNDFQGVVDIPTSINVFDTDVILAYILTGEDNGDDIWEPLPQTLFFGSDILLYGYDYTVTNIRLFLDGTIDFNSLEPIFTDNVIFRIAVIPAEAATKINTSNFNEVMRTLNVKNIKRVQLIE